MKRLLFLIFFIFSTICMADPRTDQPSPLFGDINGTNAGRYRSVKFTNGTTTNNGDGSISVTTGGGGGSGTPGGSATNLQYQINGTTFGGVSNSSVDSNGNIGLGSTAPGQILDVQGTIRAGFLSGGEKTVTQASSDNSTKIATTAYVTNAISGVNPAVAVQAATTAASDTSGLTYNNGVAGIGATFTGTANTAITIDGYTFTALNQRLLVKNDTQSPSGAFNGVYYVTTLQALGVPPILTRALDYDMPSDINNTGSIPVINGTANASTSWVTTSSVTTVGTDPLTYTEFTLNPTILVTSIGFTANQVAYASATGQALVGSSSFTFNGSNVGVGSATPGVVLDVQGTIRATGGIYLTGGLPTITTCSTGGTCTVGAGSTDWYGNVGIGTITGTNIVMALAVTHNGAPVSCVTTAQSAAFFIGSTKTASQITWTFNTTQVNKFFEYVCWGPKY